jgi:hypothetical protein
MRTWLSNPFTRRTPCPSRTTLTLESLESREVPAITIQIDYSHDTTGFFLNNPTAQATLQQAANDLAAQLSASLPAISSSGGNTWSETFLDPATGQQDTISNPSVAANTIVVYAGARVLGGNQVSVGGFGGYTASGTQAWLNSLQDRGPLGTLLWGGSVAFDTTTNWYFGTSAAGLQANQEDFFTCATHELGHVLGFGTAPTWFAQVSNGTFTGPQSEAVYGGPVPVTWGAGAELADVTVNGVRPVFDLTLSPGTRTAPATTLDWATLADIGWTVSGVPGISGDGSPVVPPTSPVVPPTSPVVPPVPPTPTPTLPSVPPAITPPPVDTSESVPVVLTGETDGSAQAFTVASDDTLVADGAPMYPFPGFTGVIRSAVADFNGDGVPDYAFVTGAGTAAEVVIINGSTGADLVAPTTILGGFTGGAFVAAGDISGDGKADLVVSADAGGGPRVQVFQVQNGALVTVADFIAFGSPQFRGGARVAVGDVNRDGYDDLIVGAGVGGGPRVSVYSGAALARGQLVSLVPDFFALDSTLRSGVYVTAGDFNGDGYADIAYSTGNTGGPRVRVVSGAELVANPGADVATLPALADFYALDSTDRNGIRIAAAEISGSGQAVLIVGSGNTTDDIVRVIPLAQMNVPTTSLENPFSNPNTVDGVYVG